MKVAHHVKSVTSNERVTAQKHQRDVTRCPQRGAFSASNTLQNRKYEYVVDVLYWDRLVLNVDLKVDQVHKNLRKTMHQLCIPLNPNETLLSL